jgi:hypothetical protein
VCCAPAAVRAAAKYGWRRMCSTGVPVAGAGVCSCAVLTGASAGQERHVGTWEGVQACALKLAWALCLRLCVYIAAFGCCVHQ